MLTPYLDYNHDIEQNVLAVCMLHQGTYTEVQHLLMPECFHSTAHLHVYEAMRDVWHGGQIIDTLSVAQQLYLNGIRKLDELSPAAFVALLCDDIVMPANTLQWCIQLRELAARRALLRITHTRINDGDVVEIATQMQQLLSQAIEVRTINDWSDTQTTAQQLCAYLQQPHAQRNDGISTTFRTIDNLNGGLRPGQLAVLGARPSVGKSALAGSIALNAALNGLHVGFISMEMPTQELFARMASLHTGTEYRIMDRGLEDGNSNLLKRIRDMATLPLHFTDNANLTIHDIRARAEQLQRTHGLHLLVVDYLQLIAEHGDSRRSREQNISAISRGLKMIAMNLQIPVLALSQLNRDSEHRADKRPTLADLRESGAIEQDADIVMLLHRDYRSGLTHTPEGHSTETNADLIVAKWRNGTCFDVKLLFEPDTMKFTEDTG